MNRVAEAHIQYEDTQGYLTIAEEALEASRRMQYAAILKKQYLSTESGDEISAIIDTMHDECRFEQLIARCFQDPDNMDDHLNDCLRAVAGHADIMARVASENADYETIMEAL